MADALIRIRVLRPLWLMRERFEAGAVIAAAPLDAAALLASTRAALVDPADAARMFEAVHKDAERTVSAAERASREANPPPWRPFGG